MQIIAQILNNWYDKNRRDLPWRDSKNPFIVWVSEIILQQTKISQGLPYFERFIKKFPTIEKLAYAEEDKILLVWQGLGYYSRARNMHFTAKYIVNELNGEFPNSFKELIKLKGIGEYTAAAIASFCFDEAVPTIDGNVYRVISRLYDIDLPIDKSEGKKLVKNICEKLIINFLPKKINQALMDFGAMLCTPQNPKCSICPLLTKCLSKAENTIEKRPVKSKKLNCQMRYFYYLCVCDNEYILIKKRSGKDIWKGLYEFPLMEKSQKVKFSSIEKDNIFKNFTEKYKIKYIELVETKPHILSHQKIYATFILLKINDLQEDNFFKIKKEELNNYAFPVLITNFLRNNIQKI